MTFFNKKEDVMDIQLTRFGKNSLARGVFKPAYYQFFDDDILYDSSCAVEPGFQEHQNDSEKRILEDTPRLKTQYITFPLERAYALETNRLAGANNMSKFISIEEKVDPNIQERILLYPISSYNISSEEAPRLLLRSHGQVMTGPVSYLGLTSSGIIKNIPQIAIESEYTIREDRGKTTDPRILTQETFIDLSSREAIFLDNSSISVTSKDVVVSMQEMNSFYGLDNFELEIYEIVEVEGEEDSLKRIESVEKINKYFHIKTDEDISSIPVEDLKFRNYYKEGES